MAIPTAGALSQQETLPATVSRDLVLVSCRVQGKGPFTCVLDTGSSMTGISPEAAKRLKLKPHAEPGAAPLDPRSLELEDLRIGLGAKECSAERVGVAPLDGISKGTGQRVDVLLGSSLFEHFQITIDSEAKQVRLAEPGASPLGDSEKIPLLLVDHVPVAILALKSKTDRRITAPFVVDTGSQSPLLLGKGFWDQHPELATSDTRAMGYSTLMHVDAIRLNQFELRGVAAGEPHDPEGVLAIAKLGGVLGAPVLDRFVVTYDYSQKTMWVKPVQDFSRPFDLP